MKKLCFQSGHYGKAGGGAPEEQANNKRITDRLSAMMRERGFEVVQTDWYANNDPVVTGNDYALFLALHCDMDYPNDGGSGFADYADPSTDFSTQESQRICAIINDVYFKESGIKYVSHSNANTRFYYMWKYLTANTPCVLLEMGQSIDPHDKVLLANTDLIASSIARALCKAFNVPYDLTPPQPSVDIPKLIKENEALKTLSEKLASEVSDLTAKLALSEKNGADWQNKYSNASSKVSNLETEVKVQSDEKNIWKNRYEAALKDQVNKYTGWQLIKMGIAKLSIKK